MEFDNLDGKDLRAFALVDLINLHVRSLIKLFASTEDGITYPVATVDSMLERIQDLDSLLVRLQREFTPLSEMQVTKLKSCERLAEQNMLPPLIQHLFHRSFPDLAG